MKHKDKLKLARRLMTPLERKLHTPAFTCSAWDERRNRIAQKVKDWEVIMQYMAAARKEKQEQKAV